MNLKSFEIRADHHDIIVFPVSAITSAIAKTLAPPQKLASINNGQPAVQNVILTGEENGCGCCLLESLFANIGTAKNMLHLNWV